MTLEFQCSLWGKYVNPTMRAHDCDLCAVPVPQGSRAHYVNGRINEDYVAGWQHVECWDKFLRGVTTETEPSIPLLVARLLEPRPS
jgi:hypothetical protein